MINKFFIAFLISLSFGYTQNLVDGIAAIVGKEIILKSEIEQHVQQYVINNKIDIRSQPELAQKLRLKTLESLVENKLMLGIAERDTIEVDPEIVDQRVEQRIKYFLDQVGSEDALEKAFNSSLKKIKKDTRSLVEESLLVEKVRQQKFAQIKISRREIEDFYTSYKDSLPKIQETVEISHILKTVKPSDDAQSTAYKKISEIKAQIDNGGNFEELAKKYSQDPASAKKGGDLGFTGRGDFVPEFETAAFQLAENEVSDIVQTQFGYHIIQLIERRGEKINTRHILIMVAPTVEDEKETIRELSALRDSALAGVSFNELAVRHSEDNNVSKDNGFLGTFEVDNLVIPQFKNIIASLKEGEISQPFKTDFGYHIIKLEKRQESRTISLDDDWQKIEDMATNFKMQKEYKKWIQDLKLQIPIEVKS